MTKKDTFGNYRNEVVIITTRHRKRKIKEKDYCMLKIIKTCASISLLCFSNYFMHLSLAPASSLHLDFLTLQGDILGLLGCLVGLFFSAFGVGFSPPPLPPFYFLSFFLDIFSLLLITWEVQVRHDEHVGTQEWFSQEQQHREKALQGMVGCWCVLCSPV